MALSVMTTLEVRVPWAVGVKVTLTVQEALTAKLAGHGLAEIAKSPEVVMDLTVTAWFPELVMVKIWAALVVLRFWAGKVREVGLTVMVVVGGF